MSSEKSSGQTTAQEPQATKPKGKRPRLENRVPFGGRSKRLGLVEEVFERHNPGWFKMWFRDEGDNLHRVRAAGYEEVTYNECGRLPPKGAHGKDPVRTHGGVGEAGRPYDVCLMKLHPELRSEDEALQAQMADDIDSSIYREEFEGGKYGNYSVQVKDEE